MPAMVVVIPVKHRPRNNRLPGCRGRIEPRTTVFSIFSPLNRPIDPRHLAEAGCSDQEKNLLRDNPIAVDHNGCVVDGQHRLKAAEQLGVPIYYQFTVDMTIEDWRIKRLVKSGR